ncbi:Uncharacterised protein [Mycobacteroides abscessus subsp. massiliense]|uniref:hypothetical protein n=1 Tax=Mycobacteroides abscessus TaxID=36809 RepID=UPI0009C9EE24|nr:hypothetical protein [Mycobacteroides abscessus]SLH43767.1 Uncharacterised protein [Mycobacteroides abscessus subsp. massiliense]
MTALDARIRTEQRRVLKELRLNKSAGDGFAGLARQMKIAAVKEAVDKRVRDEQAKRAALQERRAREQSGKAAKLSGVDREAEMLFEYVCDHPGCTRAEALGVVPSEAGWNDLLACSDIELVALAPDRPAGAYSAVRLIHARDSIMKTLSTAHGAWVTVRELREATPYSNGFRAAAIKTLGCIEHNGKNKYRRIMKCTEGKHNYEHPRKTCDEMDAQLAEARRIAGMPGTSITEYETREIENPDGEWIGVERVELRTLKSGFSHGDSDKIQD